MIRKFINAIGLAFFVAVMYVWGVAVECRKIVRSRIKVLNKNKID